MGTLAEFSSADSRLPWLWIIEYLAGFKQVETSIIHDLVEMVPDLPEELAKNMREMVALRCLEDLFGASNGHANDGLSEMVEKVGFSLSESCEDVLQHILQKSSALDRQRAGPELLKWDVHPFILHKRTSIPKCALGQLKDAILGGISPLAASLMESSGLMRVNENGGTCIDNVDHNERTRRVDGTGTDAQTMAKNANLIPPTCENGNEPAGDNSRNTSLLPSKSIRDESNDLAAENVAGHKFITETRTSTDASSLRAQRMNIADESKGQIGEDEMSSDNVEYHNEMIDVAKKNNLFLIAQCSLDNDSLEATDRTEHNLCVKCNKDGQLLVCSTTSCPSVVHENCLGSPANFDKKGKFYCPFCAYSTAISEYLEAKKKTSLARKELAVFMCMDLVQHPEKLAKRLPRKVHSHSTHNGDVEICENGHLGGQEHNQVKQDVQDVHDVSDRLCQESIGNRQQSEPSASLSIGNLPCREEAANAISETVCVPNGEKAGEENLVKECPFLRVLEGQQIQAPANHSSDSDDLTFISTDDTSVDEREAEGGIPKEDFQQADNILQEKPVFALNIDGDHTSESENEFSNYCIRFRRRERQLSFSSSMVPVYLFMPFPVVDFV
ncbi:hypothetical protein Pint_17934 [Pistacia integerrima]|uniref:Uncharacterized protein n=1 Tax=Pistacia integerrima TaxID=434235 RepID=A0ACC0YZN2_9ROSI|nr:hypothetical protein Pint_17934 [Pistacia integerrima]